MSDATSFLIESRTEHDDWRIIGSTVRTSLTFEGFTPGQAAWFRVLASNSTGESPSAAASIDLGAVPAPARRAA